MNYEIEKITDLIEIMKFGLMMTPGLAVDGDVKVAGKTPTVDEVKRM
ncbi:MAG: hypothetical protein PWP23_2723 [Candidatus Sumerlaeota bacterium]|nr:hypothetical protein [Candidatus Sumerlaeota bacterium]